MPLSLKNIRELNKSHFIAYDIGTPQSASWAPQGTGGTSNRVWSVSFYTEGGVSLQNSISSENGFNLPGVGAGKVSRLLNSAFQVVPRSGGLQSSLDFTHKQIYTGSKPINLTVTGYLVLGNSVEEDFLTPLDKIAYLSFPMRMQMLSTDSKWFSDLKGAFNDAVSQLGAGEVVESVKSWMGNLYTNVYNWANKNLSAVTGKTPDFIGAGQGWDSLWNDFFDLLGDVYVTSVPPTFRWKANTGLDFKYGSVLIPDVFINSVNVDVPSLYYEGGYPHVIKLTIGVQTLRNVTYDSFGNMFKTQV